jgi:hypothetical protein
VADGFFDLLFFHTGQCHQAVPHTQEIFTGDVQVMPQEQIIVLMDASGQGVLDRDEPGVTCL